ncbi:MAG: class I SAM-dependent methyltransferase, partial [Ilumatobacteraceae bacterium]
MRRRSQLIPWKVAGRVSERMVSGDEVVRQTGWVFNNATGSELTLAEFVATGDDEVPAYLHTFGLRSPENQQRTLVEIGAGIGRMTSAFTREFGSVIACDLDQGFLERCYETVGRFGKVERLRTLEVADGRTLDLPPNSADMAFSYITLQHCNVDDALELSSEAVRVVRPGG